MALTLATESVIKMFRSALAKWRIAHFLHEIKQKQIEDRSRTKRKQETGDSNCFDCFGQVC